MEIYVVKEGDTLENIAVLYGVSLDELSYVNQIPEPYELAVGQAILIPGEAEIGRDVQTCGYAYPFISQWVLEQTLPYLTKLLVFSYGFTATGELVPPKLPDEWMIETSERYEVAPILVLTPFGPDGKFNNNLIHQMVRDVSVRQRLIDELLQTLSDKRYVGVDVDFEYILAEDRDYFTDFVATLQRQMEANGYTVSVALAPKTSAEQRGLLYEGKDYAGLGAAADEVLLMTYEWGYTYGPAMAVSPLNKVRQVIEYALTEIPAEKINFGIPNYGYDWMLPYVRGESKAVTIGNVEAVQIAIQNGTQIQFDEIAQTPFFYYEKEAKRHEVWFEDVRSLQAKYRLLSEYNLKGIGVWQIMRLYRASWILLAGEYRII